MPLLIFIGLVVLYLLSCLKVVNTGQVYIVERFGKYNRTLEPGWRFVFTGIEVVRAKVSTKQTVMEIEPQSVITRDNIKLTIDNIVFFQVLDPRAAVYAIDNYKTGVYMTSSINMRNVVGNLNLDEILSQRDRINKDILQSVENITKKYGVEIISCEIKNIEPPKDVVNSMEVMLRAERDKRAAIFTAEGKRQADIETAEGRKRATILDAEAESESKLRRAEGEAQAILVKARAEAEAIKLVNSAITENASESVIAMKQIEAFKEMAKGAANKMIIPYEAVNTLGSIGSVMEMIKTNNVQAPKVAETETKEVRTETKAKARTEAKVEVETE